MRAEAENARAADGEVPAVVAGQGPGDSRVSRVGHGVGCYRCLAVLRVVTRDDFGHREIDATTYVDSPPSEWNRPANTPNVGLTVLLPSILSRM